MKVNKLSYSFELYLEQGSLYFDSARPAIDSGLIELYRNGTEVFLIADEFEEEFKQKFAKVGGVIK